MKKKLKKYSVNLIYIVGILSITLFLLSFTRIPYLAYRKLAAIEIQLNSNPTHIVILSGNGMPSPDALIKAYFGAETALKHPNSKVIIALPKGNRGSLKPLKMLANELIVKGIDSNRITYEPNGFNTYTQIFAISKMIKKDASILIITNPEHMYRSIKTFNKLGYSKVGSLPTFETPNEEQSLKNNSEESNQIKNVDLRYNVWSYMQYEIKVIREYFAIAYYWVKGWI